MAVSLIGEIVNSCDTITGFNQGNIGVDDDWVEGAAAIGLKIAASYQEIYTTTLGAGAPYDFSTGGTEGGYHYILWFNTKMPQPVTGKLRCIMGNGTDRAEWIVDPIGLYKGGFLTKVISPARDFDTINAGTWTTGGNPAQLTAVSQMGGGIEIVPGVMGNFNNGQLDQMTIGLGLRISGGTGGSPNTFEEARAADEDTAYYGWWSSSNGAIIGKGKLMCGSTLGTSEFTDIATAVIFAEELVATDFYEINFIGTGTTVDLELMNISAAEPNTARWDLTIESSVGSFSDTNGLYAGFREITMSANAGLTGTTLVNGNKLYQNGGSLNGITVLAANTADGVALIESDAPELISNSTFEFSTGHSIEMTSAVSTAFTFTNNSFVGYGATGTTSAAIYNNSGKYVIINVNGGDSPTVRNGVGASTLVNNPVILTLTDLIVDTEVRIYEAGTTTEVAGQESVTGGTFVYNYTFGDVTAVDIVVFKEEYLFNEPDGRISDFTLSSDNTSIPINQQFDRNYNNPP